MTAPYAKHLALVERWTMILAAVAIAASAVALPRATAFAVALGAGVMVANAYVLKRLAARVIAQSARPGFAVLLFNLKMVALIALVYLVIRYLHVDPIGFIIGISVFPVAVVAAAVQAGFAERTEGEGAAHG